MDKADKATQIIDEKRKLPEDLKGKLDNYTFINLMISIALMIYMLAINVLYLNETIQFFSTSIKVFAMLLIIIDVAIFEIGYRKDSIKIWIHGFELLICSVLVLSLQYVYLYANSIAKNIFMLLPVFYSIYYVAKIIVEHIIETKKYRNNLSDVKELVKDEEDGYLDDISNSNLVEEVNSIENMKKEEQKLIKQAKKEQKKAGGNKND
ncbi:MAG: hypothetical protein J6A36_05800 [Clostridia bacterium]|nr:hypothetical protein [Clostridia bacterium]